MAHDFAGPHGVLLTTCNNCGIAREEVSFITSCIADFKVVCDKSNNTAEDIENGKLNVVINYNPIYCSFCGKETREVFHMVMGPTVFICDECIDLCNQIINEQRIKAGKLIDE